jgi:hypothetical protein
MATGGTVGAEGAPLPLGSGITIKEGHHHPTMRTGDDERKCTCQASRWHQCTWYHTRAAG